MSIQFRADIGGLRALAIILVVAAHARIPFMSGGFIGVDLFFVISGYLITGLLLKEIVSNGRVDFASFFSRRIKRLLPALLVMLVLVSIAAAVLLAPHEQIDQSRGAKMAAIWMSNFFFAFSQFGYFDKASETFLFLHTWSLGVEEQFYLVWPFLVIFIASRYQKLHEELNFRKVCAGFCGIFLLGFIFSIVLFEAEPAWAFYLMPSRAWQFATGAMVWVVSVKPENFKFLQPMLRWRNLVALTGVAMIVVSVSLVIHASYPGIWAILPTVGTALVLLAGNDRELEAGTLEKLLAFPLFQWLGKISYSWYLWHWPVLVLGFTLLEDPDKSSIALLVVVSLVLAAGSYYMIEAPLRFNRYLSQKNSLVIFVALVASYCTYASANHWTANAKR